MQQQHYNTALLLATSHSVKAYHVTLYALNIIDAMISMKLERVNLPLQIKNVGLISALQAALSITLAWKHLIPDLLS